MPLNIVFVKPRKLVATETLARLFPRLLETFRGSGGGAGGTHFHFRDFVGISGPKVPRDICKGRAGSQL